MNKNTNILKIILVILICILLLKVFFLNKNNNTFEIIDNTISCDSALEEIFEDTNYIYYLPCIKSNNISIKFHNGRMCKLKEALNKNMVTIKQLENNGLEIYIEKIDKLSNILEKLPAVKTVRIGDTFSIDEDAIFIITDEEKVREITNILANLRDSKKEDIYYLRYFIELLDDNSNIIAKFEYSPITDGTLKLEGINSYLSVGNYENDLRDLIINNYSIPFSKLSKNIELKFQKVHSIKVKNWNSNEVIKNIVKDNDVKMIVNIIFNSKIWEGAHTLPGQRYTLELLDRDDNLIAIVDYNPQLCIEFDSQSYFLTDYDNEYLQKIIE